MHTVQFMCRRHNSWHERAERMPESTRSPTKWVRVEKLIGCPSPAPHAVKKVSPLKRSNRALSRVRARRREESGIILGRDSFLPQNTSRGADCASMFARGDPPQSGGRANQCECGERSATFSNRSPAKRVRFEIRPGSGFSCVPGKKPIYCCKRRP